MNELRYEHSGKPILTLYEALILLREKAAEIERLTKERDDARRDCAVAERNQHECAKEVDRLKNRIAAVKVVIDGDRLEEIKRDVLERVELDIKAIRAKAIDALVYKAIDKSVCKDYGDGTERLFVEIGILRQIARELKGEN